MQQLAVEQHPDATDDLEEVQFTLLEQINQGQQS